MGRRPHEPQPEEFVTQTELSKFLGITDRQIRNLTTQGLPTNGETGASRRYPLHRCREWFSDHRLSVMLREQGKVDGREAAALKMHYEAQLKGMDLLERQNVTVTVEQATEAIEKKLLAIRNRFASVPTVYAPRLTPIQTPAEMMTALQEMLNDTWASIVAEHETPSDDTDDTE